MSELAPRVDTGQRSQLSAVEAVPLTESLEPFLHQVGGHSAISHTDGRIWKPMILKELSFYQHIWSEKCDDNLRWLRDWTPRFYGLYEREEVTEPTNLHDIPLERRLSNRAKAAKDMKNSLDGGDDNNPWKKRMRELRLTQNPRLLYLSLEDLTAKFKRPCILDCKLGTRTYDNDAPPAKVIRHLEKCRITTSGAVGVRLSGMQVYRIDLGGYFFRDKYHGRKLQVEDLRPNLADFFDNGRGLRIDVIRRCLEYLKVLQARLEEQTAFKFYSSSLLLVYDGSDEDINSNAYIRMIDFAHTELSHGENDRGYALGVSTLIDLMSSLLPP